jgi:hypothetical protein
MLMKKITLFSKILAVSVHESKRVSWASQLSLETLDWATDIGQDIIDTAHSQFS